MLHNAIAGKSFGELVRYSEDVFFFLMKRIIRFLFFDAKF